MEESRDPAYCSTWQPAGNSRRHGVSPGNCAPFNDLVEALLYGPSSLSPGERELIATYVCSLNDCHYCQSIHGAIAAAHLDGNEELVRRVKADFHYADISVS